MNVKAEREAVISALHQIEDFCTAHIVPNLKHQDRVSVEFGKLERYGYGWEREYEHSFTVFANGQISYRTGGLILRFKTETWDNATIYGSWSYGKDLLLYWQEVK